MNESIVWRDVNRRSKQWAAYHRIPGTRIAFLTGLLEAREVRLRQSKRFGSKTLQMKGLRVKILQVIPVLCALLLGAHVSAREIHVAKHGDDSSAGTLAAPYRTISKAAAEAQVGDEVVVAQGTYREQVQPARGGTSESQRIVYRAAEGDEVVIKGSEQITSWVDQGNGAWLVELPDLFFGDFNPYARNVSGNWLTYGGWHHLGDVYLDNEALREQQTLSEVQTTSDTWYAEVSGGTTKIWANFGGADPNTRLAEINVREAVFYPAQAGLDYITVDGFSIMHSANNWAPPTETPQVGAIGPREGRSWIIENCTVVNARSVGISIGRHDGWSGDIESIGHHVIRNNIIRRSGQAGIIGHTWNAASLIEGNLIEDTNYRDEFGGWETAAIKFHSSVDTVIRNNLIRWVSGSAAAYGIWIDYGCQGTRISGNVILETEKDTLRLEANHGAIVVDHNVVIGGAVTWRATDATVFAHNLFYDSQAILNTDGGDRGPPRYVPHTRQYAGNEDTTVSWQRIYNNIFMKRGIAPPGSAGTDVDYNVYLEGASRSAWDENSVVDPFAVGFSYTSDETGVSITFDMNDSPSQVGCPLITKNFIGVFPVVNQGIEEHDGTGITLDRDYFDNTRASSPMVGPFEDLKPSGANTYRLFDTPGLEFPVGPAEVSSQDSGIPLTVTASDATSVTWEWENLNGTSTYQLYRGTIASVRSGTYDHGMIDASYCSLTGTTTTVSDKVDGIDSYYLVGAHENGIDGSLGEEPSGAARPPGSPTCP
jgi:hypothetical protein